jgi:hypothetical protein
VSALCAVGMSANDFGFDERKEQLRYEAISGVK